MRKSVTRAAGMAAALAFLAATASGRAASGQDHNRRNVEGGISSLPFQAQALISQSLGRDLPEFEVRAAQGAGAGKFQTNNAKQNIAAEFGPDGVSLQTGGVAWGVGLKGYGYSGSLTPAAAVAPSARHNRVEYRRGMLTEWYANGPLGIEQGFTVSKRPALTHALKDGRGPLTIVLGLRGDLAAAVDRDGAGLTLSDPHGKAVLRYMALTAVEAGGKRLGAHMELRGHELLLRVNDAAARYPLTIDPIVQIASIQGQLNLDAFGNAMALSGKTLVIGAPEYPSFSTGRVFVYVEPPGGWTNDMSPTATLRANNKNRNDFLGSSVAISGSTIAATADGYVYLYLEPPGGWKNMSESAVLSGSDGFDGFQSVSMTSDTVAAGGPYATVGSNAFQGAVYVWVKPASGWTSMTQTAELTASDGQTDDHLGHAVAISNNTIVAGAPDATVGSNAEQGAGYVFVKPSSGWADGTETAKLTAADGAPEQVLGQSVAISGNTAICGAPGATINGNVDQGAAYIFVAPPTGWVSITSTAKLTASDGAEYDDFGDAVAISGNTLAVGAVNATVNDVSGSGTAYLFAKPKGGWKSTSNFNSKLIPSDLWRQGGFGWSVLVSSGSVWAAAPGANYEIGEVYLFGSPQ